MAQTLDEFRTALEPLGRLEGAILILRQHYADAYSAAQDAKLAYQETKAALQTLGWPDIAIPPNVVALVQALDAVYDPGLLG